MADAWFFIIIYCSIMLTIFFLSTADPSSSIKTRPVERSAKRGKVSWVNFVLVIFLYLVDTCVTA